MEVEAEEEAKVSNACRCSWWLHALVHITVKWYSAPNEESKTFNFGNF